MRLQIFLFALVLASCAERDKNGKLLDTPVSGTIKVVVDESLKPLMQAEVEGFLATYPDAHVNVEYTSEGKAINDMLIDSARVAVVTRKLYAEEKAPLDSLKIRPTEFVFAKDGIALIVNKENPDSTIRMEQFTAILKGELTQWKQLYPSSPLGDLKVVFDNPQSGIVRYVTDTLNLKSLPSTCFAVQTNEAVVDYVAKTKNAIGLIGLSWISDVDDPAANRFLSTIKVMGIWNEDDFYKPYKGYIALRKYPMSRQVVMITREARTGLGSGFITYAGSDKGQKIVLKAGLVPGKASVRVVQFNRQPMDKIVADKK